MARETYQGDDFHATWVEQHDPLWEELADRWSIEIGKGQRDARGRPRKPIAGPSKHAKGIGTFFRTAWLEQIAQRSFYR